MLLGDDNADDDDDGVGFGDDDDNVVLKKSVFLASCRGIMVRRISGNTIWRASFGVILSFWGLDMLVSMV